MRRASGHGVRRASGLGAVAAALAVVLAPLGPVPAQAEDHTFPYVNDFTTADGGTLTGSARIVDGRLRLTPADVGVAGAWAMDDAFPSTLGLDVEFDYAMYTPYEQGADGLLLYLADGSVAPGVGGTGAALGYACRTEQNEGSGPCQTPGLPGGFAAVALDLHGNFSLPINGSGPGRSPNTVTVRGSGNGTDGYRFVDNAAVRSGVETDGPTTRTVRVTLQPGDDGLELTVRLTTGGVTTTVLDSVQLGGDGQAPLPDTLRLGFTGATGAYRSVHEIDALRVAQPADLRVQHETAPAVAGERVRYAVSAANTGRNDSEPSPFTVDVPDQLSDVTWTCSASDGSACGDGSGTGDVDTALDLVRGGTARVAIEGTLDPAAEGELTSVATIDVAPGLADVDESDNTSTATTPITVRADVETDKRVSPSTDVEPGDQVEYVVTARNRGPAVAQDVGAVDDLPAAMSFAGSDDDCTAEGQHVTCRSGESLAVGQEHAFRIRAVLDPEYRGDGSDVVNVATATSPTDPDGGDPSDEVAIVVPRPDDPDADAGATPGPTPTRTPSPQPSGSPTAGPTTGHASDRGDGGGSTGHRTPAAPGTLAYTGAAGTALAAGIGVLLLVLGGGCWVLARRRRRAPDEPVRGAAMPGSAVSD